jgi:TonB family protein
MKIIVRLTVFCCAALACATLAFSQTPPPAAEYSEKAWKEFSSLEGRFTVLMPGSPAKESRSVQTHAGRIGLEVFELKTGVASYLITYSDFPRMPEDPQTALKHARDGAVENAKGKLLHEKKISLDGHPGLELIIETPSTIIKSAFYAVKQRLYQVVILLPPDRGLPKEIIKFQDSVATKFLGSFKLMPSENKALPVSLTSPALVDTAINQGYLDKPPAKVLPLSERALKELAIKQVEPVYTQEAKDALASGAVQVEILISEEGRVIEAKAMSGNPLLYDAAIQAAKQWIFKPARSSGAPTQMRGTLTFLFFQEQCALVSQRKIDRRSPLTPARSDTLAQ